MSLEWSVVIAVGAAAATAWLSTTPHRLRPRGDPPWRRALPVLAPVEGAIGIPARAFLATALGCLVLLVAAGPAGALAPWLGGIAGCGLFVASGRFRSGAARRREEALSRAVPVVCTSLAVCLEAGLPLRTAVDVVAAASDGPVAGPLRRLAAAERLGVPQDDAWRELGERHAAFSSLARELRHTSGTGAAVAPMLRQHGREARAAIHAAAQERARRAGVSTVLPLIACFLPAFLLIGVVPVVGGVVARLFG